MGRDQLILAASKDIELTMCRLIVVKDNAKMKCAKRLFSELSAASPIDTN